MFTAQWEASNDRVVWKKQLDIHAAENGANSSFNLTNIFYNIRDSDYYWSIGIVFWMEKVFKTAPSCSNIAQYKIVEHETVVGDRSL